MNIVADENVDKAIVDRLRESGHVVFYVAEFEPSLEDADVLQKAN